MSARASCDFDEWLTTWLSMLSLQHFPLLRFGVNSSPIFLAFSRFHRPVHEMNAFDRVRPSAAKMQALQGKQNKKEQELRITIT